MSTSRPEKIQIRLSAKARQAWEEAAGVLPISSWVRRVVAERLRRQDLLDEERDPVRGAARELATRRAR